MDAREEKALFVQFGLDDKEGASAVVLFYRPGRRKAPISAV
jgi:hypothetical protein